MGQGLMFLTPTGWLMGRVYTRASLDCLFKVLTLVANTRSFFLLMLQRCIYMLRKFQVRTISRKNVMIWHIQVTILLPYFPYFNQTSWLNIDGMLLRVSKPIISKFWITNLSICFENIFHEATHVLLNNCKNKIFIVFTFHWRVRK